MRALIPLSDRATHRFATMMLVACALVLTGTAVTVVWPRVSHVFGVRPVVTHELAYKPGQVIDVPRDWYQSAPYTVVLFARASCGACQSAQPFFTQLVFDLKGRAAVVLAASDESRDADAEYGRALGLTDPAIRVTPAGLKVRAAPTLVLINQRGEILGAWEGVGPERQQMTIAKAIDSAIGVKGAS